jgi:glycosyltransferase involved in cell wall biosynthesis
MNRRLLFVVNVDWFFRSHRLPIALKAKEHGYEVHLATEFTAYAEEFSQLGFRLHPLPSMRGAAGLLRSLLSLFALIKLFRRVEPDLVHLVTIRPVVLGGIAARIARVPAVLSAISGLGYVFVDTGFRAWIRRTVVSRLYSVALGHRNLKVVFQNRDDRDEISDIAGVDARHIEIIRGSGVDLTTFCPSELPGGKPLVMFAARMLRDKGVLDFVSAARMLQDSGFALCGGVRFALVGDIDPGNPASLSEEELAAIASDAGVEVWGARPDMHRVLPLAWVVVLPSYREGLPRVLIEAAACGRAVVTTDVPGCRDAIEPGVTGLLVPPRSPQELAEALKRLLNDPARCSAMGSAGRALAETSFDIRGIVERHMSIYAELLGGGGA